MLPMQQVPSVQPPEAHRVRGLDMANLSESEAAELKRLIYEHKIVVVEGQDLKPAELVKGSASLGAIENYFQTNYHHPEHPEIFVSSNVPMNGKKVGVSGTGRYWHCDYQFFARPFTFVCVYPVILPDSQRFTHFVDMGEALRRMPADILNTLMKGIAIHDPKLKYKIQASDIDKAIDEILAEVAQLVPPLRRKAVVQHPVTGEDILFMSPGFTRGIEGLSHEDNEAFMARMFEHVLQEQYIYSVEWKKGDLLIWDNVSVIHKSSAKGVGGSTASTNYRVTMYDTDPGATPPFLAPPPLE